MPNQNNIPKSTKKEDVAYLLPGTFTTVYQSNRITNGTFQGFGLLHTRIFIAIVKSLQAAIRAEMNGLDWQQLDLFEGATKDSIQVKLILKEITTPNHYPNAIKAAKELMGLVIKLKKPDAPKGYISFRTLFTGVDQPIKLGGKTVLIIHILKSVAKEIVFLDKNRNGESINFTKYLYENAMSSSSKYTIRMYILISSWKNKGGFYITVPELRRILDLKEHEYINFAAFKKRVLIPVQQELERQGDCWFNVGQKDFENRAGKKVVGINFKIISKMTVQKNRQKKDHLRHLLVLHAGFSDKDLKLVEAIFQDVEKLDDIIIRLIDLIGRKKDEHGKRIEHKVAYISRSLLYEFGQH